MKFAIVPDPDDDPHRILAYTSSPTQSTMFGLTSGELPAAPPTVARSVALFLLAGLCEIGGGYLVWLWLREHRSALLGAVGGLALFLYGVLPTLQPAHFGRVYAAYGGVFVVLSLLWGWWVDGHRPDRPDAIGAAICLLGVAVIMYWPRST